MNSTQKLQADKAKVALREAIRILDDLCPLDGPKSDEEKAFDLAYEFTTIAYGKVSDVLHRDWLNQALKKK